MKSSQAENVELEAMAVKVDATGISSAKSNPPRRSISFWLFIAAAAFILPAGVSIPPETILPIGPLGGGARGAGKVVGLLDNIDSRLAIPSLRPDSIDSRSPIPRSGGAWNILGTSERYEKSSADSSRSLAGSSSLAGA
jgi:hypothetical protein